MSDCPRCGAPLDPDAARCLACENGAPPRLDLTSLRRNAASDWTAMGAAVGGIVGLCLGAAVAFGNLLLGGGPGVVYPVGMALIGAVLGAAGVMIWKSLVRPVILALFASEAFQREYGTPEERGIVGRPPSGGREE